MRSDELVPKRHHYNSLLARVLNGKLIAKRVADRGEFGLGLLCAHPISKSSEESEKVDRVAPVPQRIRFRFEGRDEIEIRHRHRELCGQHPGDNE